MSEPEAHRNEKVWTMLVADLLAHSPNQRKLVRLLCGCDVDVADPLDIWFEAQPIPSRKGASGHSEGNSKIDLAVGDIQPRIGTGAGIEYGPPRDHSWVCFVEAKCLSDCSTDVPYDPLRNQLTRAIENLLCFQGGGGFPDRLFFTLLTPRLFKAHPTTRLYGYKLREYQGENRTTLLRADIEGCPIPKRDDAGFHYPQLSERIGRLAVQWITYEEILQSHFDADLDIVQGADRIGGLKEHLRGLVSAMQLPDSGA
jgi:hypothetical protein